MVRRAVVEEARECLLGLVTYRGKQVEKGATLGYMEGAGMERLSWTAQEVLFPQRPKLEEGYVDAGWT